MGIFALVLRVRVFSDWLQQLPQQPQQRPNARKGELLHAIVEVMAQNPVVPLLLPLGLSSVVVRREILSRALLP